MMNTIPSANCYEGALSTNEYGSTFSCEKSNSYPCYDNLTPNKKFYFDIKTHISDLEFSHNFAKDHFMVNNFCKQTDKPKYTCGDVDIITESDFLYREIGEHVCSLFYMNSTNYVSKNHVKNFIGFFDVTLRGVTFNSTANAFEISDINEPLFIKDFIGEQDLTVMNNKFFLNGCIMSTVQEDAQQENAIPSTELPDDHAPQNSAALAIIQDHYAEQDTHQELLI